MNRDSVVGIAARLWAGDPGLSSWQGQEIFKHLGLLCCPPSLLLNGYQELFSRGKVTVA
jgi:hypothetical protein